MATLDQLAMPAVVPGIDRPGEDQLYAPCAHLPASLAVVALDPAELRHGG